MCPPKTQTYMSCTEDVCTGVFDLLAPHPPPAPLVVGEGQLRVHVVHVPLEGLTLEASPQRHTLTDVTKVFLASVGAHLEIILLSQWEEFIKQTKRINCHKT